ncbi:hypothetical protein LPJ81_002138 [Coemansia sp. IMI 209127]|nr:hypothetical protein LPJ81_002138 [Coemansia sp. IMI 209127]
MAFSDDMLWVIRDYSANEMNMNSVERIMQYLKVEQEAALDPDPENKPSALWPQKGDVQIENLVVEYTPGVPVLHDISLSAKHGEKVGVIGRTGAGKSSMSLALLRYLEASKGRIVLDGVDISKIGLEDLRRNVTVIPQDPVLFNGTIRFNLDPFDEHPDELLWDALRRTHLVRERESQSNSSTVGVSEGVNKNAPSLERMAGIFTSLDAEIKENGQNLSQGQRQLVSLARALVRRSKLIIMDEATASVDFDTDERIQHTIRGPEFANSTLFCIAHRLRTIIDYDKVLVLDKGRVAEFDTPHNLLQIENGIFRSMCEKTGEFKYLVAAAATNSRKVQAPQDKPNAGDGWSVSLTNVIDGFGEWRNSIPNADAIHGFAVWEIYRSHAELSQDDIRRTGDEMFIRWKSTVILRILQDFNYFFNREKAAQLFHDRWLKVSNRWYHFEPGGDELSGTLSFRNSPITDSRLNYFIHSHSGQSGFDTTDSPSASPPSLSSA